MYVEFEMNANFIQIDIFATISTHTIDYLKGARERERVALFATGIGNCDLKVSQFEQIVCLYSLNQLETSETERITL